MKMKLSQLRAISYSYSEKNRRENVKKLNDSGLDLVFDYQTKYKTIAGFNNATPANKTAAVLTAIPIINNRIMQLEKCGCTSEKYDNACGALCQAKAYLAI